MNDYARAPNQPLLTTSSPTFAGLTINGAATFAATVTATGQFLAGDGTVAAPSYSFSGYPDNGWYMAASNSPALAVQGISVFRAAWNFLWIPSDTIPLLLGAAQDLSIGRLGAASFRLGSTPSASPIAQTFTIGEASRPGTDSNVGGANGTIRSGLGTGTGTPSTVKIQGAVVAASGSTVQTYGTFIEGSGTTLGFYGVTPIARAVLATGAGRTVDDVITALQNLGLVKQS